MVGARTARRLRPPLTGGQTTVASRHLPIYEAFQRQRSVTLHHQHLRLLYWGVEEAKYVALHHGAGRQKLRLHACRSAQLHWRVSVIQALPPLASAQLEDS